MQINTPNQAWDTILERSKNVLKNSGEQIDLYWL